MTDGQIESGPRIGGARNEDRRIKAAGDEKREHPRLDWMRTFYGKIKGEIEGVVRESLIETESLSGENLDNEIKTSRLQNIIKKLAEKRKREVLENKRDKLTGLYSLPIYYEWSPVEQRHLKERLGVDKEKIMLVGFFDIDNFKSINDEFGHDKGDLVIQEVGKRLTKAISKSDIAIRVGGDEFMFILNGIDKEKFNDRLDEIKDQLSQNFTIPLNDGKSTDINIAISMGVKIVEKDDEFDSETVRSEVDEATRIAKSAKIKNESSIVAVGEEPIIKKTKEWFSGQEIRDNKRSLSELKRRCPNIYKKAIIHYQEISELKFECHTEGDSEL